MIYDWFSGDLPCDGSLLVFLDGRLIPAVRVCCTGRDGWIIQSLNRLKKNADEVTTKTYYGSVIVRHRKCGIVTAPFYKMFDHQLRCNSYWNRVISERVLKKLIKKAFSRKLNLGPSVTNNC